MVIVLSSSPPARSPDASKNTETARKIAIPGHHGLCTPTKDHRDIWEMPSSSPLPSPGELLRGLQQPNARRGEQSKIGKSFKTARELLEIEGMNKDLWLGDDDNRHAEEYAVIVSEKTTTQAKSVAAAAKARAPRKTVAKFEKTVKRTATVSTHFSKKSKTANASKNPKSLSSAEKTKPDEVSTLNQMVSSHVNVTKLTEERSKSAEAELDQSVPARRRDWTPVRNTVPVVEIISSPMVQRTEYEKNLDAGGLTTGIIDESTLPKQDFEHKIGLFKFEYNSKSTPSTGTTFASAGIVGSTSGATKRRIQYYSHFKLLEKPHLSRSLSSFSGPAKTSVKKGRKKAETITDLATAQYCIEKVDNPEQPPSITDFLTKWKPEAISNDTELPVKKQKRQTKSKAAAEGKKATNRKGRRKVSKEEVEDPPKLLSPQSAIRRTNEQQVIFGTFSQLTDGKVDTPPDTEASEPQESSNSFSNDISASYQFGCGITNAKTPELCNTLDEEAEALEEFLHGEFDQREVTKAKELLKRKGLWGAASGNDDIVDLSKASDEDQELELSLLGEGRIRKKRSKEQHTPTQVRSAGLSSPIPVLQNLPQGTESMILTSNIEKFAERALSPSKRKKKKGLLEPSVDVLKSIPLAEESDAGAPSTLPRKGKKWKGETARSPRSKKKPKAKKETSPVKFKAKRRAKSPPSPPSSPARKRHRSPSDKANEVIHSNISKAITAEYSSTNDVVNSWHYKILTYEPIILEDFTVWLNTVGFANAGIGGGVSPEVVKSWAEARSVVNVWRETLRGSDRKRF